MRKLSLLFLLAASWQPLWAEEIPPQLTRWLQPHSWERDLAAPIVSLGPAGAFDDQHIFAPAIAFEHHRYSLWYSGSQGTPGNRVFRLGLATSDDGMRFEKHAANPVLAFADDAHSVLTPAPLRASDGAVLRENGQLRLYFSAARLGKSGLHTLHQSRSTDGLKWDEPSPPLREHVYCPSVLKLAAGDYHLWYSDVSRRPWVIRHAHSHDGTEWTPTERPALTLSQSWEGEVLVYPTVLKVDGVYLMWYGSYDHAHRRETTAIGLAASLDGRQWFKNPHNPVFRPAPDRDWESNYVGSGSVLQLPDGSFRYYYASRKAPPFRNLYFAINTATWRGPAGNTPRPPLRMPPVKDDQGWLVNDPASGRSLDLLERIDDTNAIVRLWYIPAGGQTSDATFLDVWLRGVPIHATAGQAPLKLPQLVAVVGNQVINTTCGSRSFLVLEASQSEAAQ